MSRVRSWETTLGSWRTFYNQAVTSLRKGIIQIIDMMKSMKLKVAIFLGYNGCSFLGLQFQRDTANTIQNILHRVLCEQGFILKSNMENLRRIKWSRAGRTDKKVHALCNGISASLELDDRYLISREGRQFDLEKVASDINADLPTDIRILAIKRVGKSFDMRYDACSRVYSYIAPLKLFYSKQQLLKQEALNQLEQHELVNKLDQLFQLYLGTHSFHNFTKGYKSTDPRCDRFIVNMKAQMLQQSVVEEALANLFQNEEEKAPRRIKFVRFTLVGQSFIYHQIRKMVGLLVKICFEELEGVQTMRKAFGKQQFNVYLTPGEGLYLNRMTFDQYNRKKEPALRVQLDEEDEKRISLFQKYLQGVILTHQLKDELFTKWLQMHDQKQEQEQNHESEQEDEEFQTKRK